MTDLCESVPETVSYPRYNYVETKKLVEMFLVNNMLENKNFSLGPT